MAQRLSQQGGNLNVLGRRVRALREERGISQAELARMLQRAGWDVDPVVLNKVEVCRRTFTDIELLLVAKVLKLDLGDIQQKEAGPRLRAGREPEVAG